MTRFFPRFIVTRAFQSTRRFFSTLVTRPLLCAFVTRRSYVQLRYTYIHVRLFPCLTRFPYRGRPFPLHRRSTTAAPGEGLTNTRVMCARLFFPKKNIKYTRLYFKYSHGIRRTRGNSALYIYIYSYSRAAPCRYTRIPIPTCRRQYLYQTWLSR